MMDVPQMHGFRVHNIMRHDLSREKDSDLNRFCVQLYSNMAVSHAPPLRNQISARVRDA